MIDASIIDIAMDLITGTNAIAGITPLVGGMLLTSSQDGETRYTKVSL